MWRRTHGAVMVDAMPTASKAALRKRLLTARRGVDDAVRAAEARALNAHLTAALPCVGVTTASTVCAYAPADTEPGSIAVLDSLLEHAARVLLPVSTTTADGIPLPLRWGEYRPGRLVTGRFGLKEPPQPWLAPSALADARLVLIPALAVDAFGVRLGRGSGFYDRSLVHRQPGAALVAVVRDEELVEVLPAEPHDVPMTHALTPGRGLIALEQSPRAVG